MIPPLYNCPSEDYTSQQLQRMTSTSEEEEETQNNSDNEWQMIRHTKRKNKIHRTQHNTPETKIETHNRYGLLTNETKEDSIDGNPSSTKIHKRPPIFVRTWCYKLRRNDNTNEEHSRR